MPKDNIKLKNIFLLGFLFALHIALIAYVNSSFLSLFLAEKNVGLLFTIGSIVSIIMLLVTPKILRKIGSYKFLLWSVGINGLFLFLLSTIKSSWLVIPIFISYFAINGVIIFSLDELLEISTKNRAVGKIRGLYVTTVSSAWIIAQGVSGTIINNFSFSTLYLFSALIMVVVFLISCISLRNLPDPKYDRVPILKSIVVFFKNKNLARSYKINFLLQFFYASMVIYTPIYLNSHIGFNWSEIGIIFMIMLTPFVILPFPLGKYSDKIGERKMLILGFTFASLSTLSLFFIKEPQIWIWALILFVTRIGASTIETMSDVYFFKHITPENDEFVGIYRNTTPVAYILAPVVAFIIFTFTPSFNYIYVALSLFMFYGIYLTSTIKKRDV